MSKSLIDCYLDQLKYKFVKVAFPYDSFSTYISFIDKYVPELRDYFVYYEAPPRKENLYLLIFIGPHDFGGEKYVAACQDMITKQVFIFDIKSLSFADDPIRLLPKITKRYNKEMGPPPPELVRRSRDMFEERDRWFSA